ncbi:endoglucanase [Sporosarcina sp. FSL W7-1283]|uniref:endoglucanase n=1 Tax=Sporosarcina sp. FSL W7-1283 TaxID=2921560 RepID=UPI0030F9061E
MDGRYVFRACVPDGDVVLANVAPGDVLNREWTFRANLPPEVQEAIDAGEFDPRNISTGKDGELYDEDGNFLAEVNTWQMAVGFTNIDYNPAGDKIVWAIPDSYTVTLTFTETIIRDAILLQKALTGLKKRSRGANLSFTGVLRTDQE